MAPMDVLTPPLLELSGVRAA
ncbi:MAG: hypothetical protein JWN29_3657, partial [Acidimicrobiales bacterium]|nr:hypothetical protein [Acidimicrobiales bacterium]